LNGITLNELIFLHANWKVCMTCTCGTFYCRITAEELVNVTGSLLRCNAVFY